MSSFGTIYKVTTYGESHCKSVGCIIDGCPPGMKIDTDFIQGQLSRRRPGQSDLTTPRNEYDLVEIQSGVEFGVSLGTPILLLVKNKDQRPKDYTETEVYPRPSHADYTYLLKYGLKASSGGGRSSARETIGRVAAGAIAEYYLKNVFGVEIVAFVCSAGQTKMRILKLLEHNKLNEYQDELNSLLNKIGRDEVDSDQTRCPEKDTAQLIRNEIIDAKQANDSIGGSVMCVIRNMPGGIGEPCFDKLEAKLAHAMLSIPSTKGFEIGSGFKGTELKGSTHNDAWVKPKAVDKETKVPTEVYEKKLQTKTNNSGGVQGGISNSQHVYFRVAFKPPATISQSQTTASYSGEEGVLSTRGRHDPCVVPRAVPIVEAMAAITVMDCVMLQYSRKAATMNLPNIEVDPSMKGTQ